MGTTMITIDEKDILAGRVGRLDSIRLDSTTDEDLALQERTDINDARLDAAANIRRIRKNLGLSQKALSERIDVSLDTIRNWEQGKREPTGAARALFKILGKNPELALTALES